MSSTPPPDRGELRPVANQGQGRADLVRDSQEGEGGVLVEHPGLVHHDSLASDQPRLGGGAGVGTPVDRSTAHDPACAGRDGPACSRGGGGEWNHDQRTMGFERLGRARCSPVARNP